MLFTNTSFCLCCIMNRWRNRRKNKQLANGSASLPVMLGWEAQLRPLAAVWLPGTELHRKTRPMKGALFLLCYYFSGNVNLDRHLHPSISRI